MTEILDLFRRKRLMPLAALSCVVLCSCSENECRQFLHNEYAYYACVATDNSHTTFKTRKYLVYADSQTEADSLAFNPKTQEGATEEDHAFVPQPCKPNPSTDNKYNSKTLELQTVPFFPRPSAADTATRATAPLPAFTTWVPFLAPYPTNPSILPSQEPAIPATLCRQGQAFIYEVQHTNSQVGVSTTCSASLIPPIPVASRPLQLALTPDQSTLLVTSYDNAVTFIDTATKKVSATLQLPNHNPQGIAISPDGNRAYVTHYLDILPQLLIIDIPNRKLLSTIPMPYQYPRQVTVSPDGTQAWVNYLFGNVITVVDLITNTVAANIGTTYPAEYGIAFNPTGTKAYVAVYPNSVFVIDTATLSVKSRLTVCQEPVNIVATPDGKRVFASCDIDPQVYWIDPTTDKVIGSGKLPNLDQGGIVGLAVTLP